MGQNPNKNIKCMTGSENGQPKCPSKTSNYTCIFVKSTVTYTELDLIMHVYKAVRSCPTETYYTLTNGKINSNQLYLSLYSIPKLAGLATFLESILITL